ncbi:hypothetical protein EW026_g3101 [Hermanssonia centrifuga]|uniref:Translation initiation factor IF-2, mitochondrial n=1 Tax=Hermanssonia centrifuga TaxID=98765 RepID=A0A4S4KLT7_9APHY|nr:hypothetical protein EW026_g3101 [Hermanssonia centrifuga]
MKEVKPQRRKYVQATRDVYIPSAVSVGNLAKLLNVRLDTLQRKMVRAGMNDEASYDHILTAEWASLIAMEFGINPVVDDEAAFDIYPPAPAADSSTLPARPPVVTIMGHVDHGKTTLLDTLRSASVAKGEAGGITQHIGAFSVPVPGPDDDPKSERFITFLDTPGHAAFSAMRARGAGVTDIIVLVVAADDGIMPQTREVLELVKKEPDVGLVVAINKIDKAGADISKVEKALFAEGVQFESFGGDIPSVHVSGLTGQGLPQLVETISLIAELQDLRAERTGMVQGYVIESKIQKGLGAVATVLVSRGELTPGTHLIAGTAPGKVRLLTSPSGGPVKSVSPGTAAVVSGWKELPKAGDEVLSGSESEIKRAVANRLRKIEIETSLQDVEAINLVRREERERKEAEEEKDREETEKTVEKKDEKKGVEDYYQRGPGVGDVSESDVMRAKAAEGMVVAFSVKIPRPIEAMAASQGVQFLKSSVIYHLMDQVKERVIGLLPIKVETKVTGEANVLQLFDIRLKRKQTMKVAGCRVIYGVVDKDKKARVIRKGKTVHEGKLETLRQIKKDIMQAGKGMECGMAFEGWDDLRDGDLIQVYEEIEKAGSL